MLTPKQDLWYFHTSRQGTALSLLINVSPLENVTVYQAVLDQDNNPHLVFVEKERLHYYYWEGCSWTPGASLIDLNPAKLYLTLGEKKQLYLLTQQVGEKEISYLKLKNGQWKEENFFPLPKKAKIEAFLSWSPQLLILIYTYEVREGQYLGWAMHKNEEWKVAQEIYLGRGHLLNWFSEGGRLFFLVGENKITGSILSLCTISEWEKSLVPKLVNLGTIPGLDGLPVLCKDKKGQLKIFWQYRGSLWLADLEQTSFMLSNPQECQLFFPLEISSPIREDSLPEYLAFKKIHGTKLTFPLVLSVDNILQMVKGKQITS